MPGTFVSSDSFTAGPPVTRSSVTSAPSESSFSGRRPTESSSVSHGMYFSEPGTGLRSAPTSASVTPSSRSLPWMSTTVWLR